MNRSDGYPSGFATVSSPIANVPLNSLTSPVHLRRHAQRVRPALLDARLHQPVDRAEQQHDTEHDQDHQQAEPRDQNLQSVFMTPPSLRGARVRGPAEYSSNRPRGAPTAHPADPINLLRNNAS
jgi:hypothetical protein